MDNDYPDIIGPMIDIAMKSPVYLTYQREKFRLIHEHMTQDEYSPLVTGRWCAITQSADIKVTEPDGSIIVHVRIKEA